MFEMEFDTNVLTDTNNLQSKAKKKTSITTVITTTENSSSAAAYIFCDVNKNLQKNCCLFYTSTLIVVVLALHCFSLYYSCSLSSFDSVIILFLILSSSAATVSSIGKISPLLLSAVSPLLSSLSEFILKRVCCCGVFDADKVLPRRLLRLFTSYVSSANAYYISKVNCNTTRGIANTKKYEDEKRKEETLFVKSDPPSLNEIDIFAEPLSSEFVIPAAATAAVVAVVNCSDAKGEISNVKVFSIRFNSSVNGFVKCIGMVF